MTLALLRAVAALGALVLGVPLAYPAASAPASAPATAPATAGAPAPATRTAPLPALAPLPAPAPAPESVRPRAEDHPPPAPAARAQPPDWGWVGRRGRWLTLGGQPRRFTGVNAYELATLWGVNAGCGPQVDHIGAFLRSLPANSLVRVWAFQALNRNVHTRALDFAGLDRVVAAATRYHQHLVLTLSDQGGTCDDGHYHDAAWYAGGYRLPYDNLHRGLTPLSFWQWVQVIVPRYASSPAVAAWEPVNEPEPSVCAGYTAQGGCLGPRTCPPEATSLLAGFLSRVGARIHRLDPRHLVAEGVMGGTQCGVSGDGFATLAALRPVDLLTYHDYGSPTAALPAELSIRLAQAGRADKPLIVEEAGIRASAGGTNCFSRARRAGLFDAKLLHALRAGAAGWLLWDWVPAAARSCDYDVTSGDPVLGLLGAPG